MKLKLNHEIRFYSGNSMLGTFLPGDCLYIDKDCIDKIIPGDIILFKTPDNEGDKHELVHRVIKITSHGLITKGDNNHLTDNIITVPDSKYFIGRVVAFERNGRKKKEKGGFRGLSYAKYLKLKKILTEKIKFLFKPLYLILRKSGFIRRIWHPQIKKIYLNSKKGIIIKYLYFEKTIAVWIPECNYFSCRKPFDLIIDPPSYKNYDKKCSTGSANITKFWLRVPSAQGPESALE